jgi:hypothetical protein
VAVSSSIGRSSARSPATRAKAPALRAHMVRVGLGNALGSARQVQWAAVSKCYSGSGVCAHLTALNLMLLVSSTAVFDRVFTHGLRVACPWAAPAFPSDGRPPRRRASAPSICYSAAGIFYDGGIARLQNTQYTVGAAFQGFRTERNLLTYRFFAAFGSFRRVKCKVAR